MKKIISLFILLFIFSYCSKKKKEENNSNNETTQMETTMDDGWVSLIQPDSFEGWHIYQNKENTKSGWKMEGSILTFDSSIATGKKSKSLVTDREYEDFVLYLEWKVAKSSNSGVMWGVNESEEYAFPYLTGPEIQVLDVGVYQDQPEHDVHNAGALYDMIAPSEQVSKPIGEWNTYELTIDHKENKASLIFNDKLVLSFPLQGEEWDNMVSNSKFKDMKDFGKFSKGKICLQEHPGVISYRNIKIKELNQEGTE